MRRSQPPDFSREFSRYAALVQFLRGKEEAGILGAADMMYLLAVDGELYQQLHSMSWGKAEHPSPERAVAACASILALMDLRWPEVAKEAERLGPWTKDYLAAGATRYVPLMGFLQQKHREGMLSPGDLRALVNTDEGLYQQTCPGTERGWRGDARAGRACVAVFEISRRLMCHHPELAQEWQLLNRGRSR